VKRYDWVQPLAMAGLLLAIFTTRPSEAQSASVPADVQAELISKLVSYDRSYAARAGDVARMLIVVQPDNAKSRLSAADMKAALGRIDRVGGLPHRETIVAYEGAVALAETCRAAHIAVVYLTPGLEGEIEQLRMELAKVSVLSVAALSDYVPEGIVVGFDLESGKPKLLINLEQARLQSVDFPADVLRLMRVYR
jgi:hypothetical protein